MVNGAAVTAGIVAEYNPFHNGHSYHLAQTKMAGADRIVAVMSGTAVQRGDIAVLSKYERAAAAVENGVDLVIELPCPYSCACAEHFARAAVTLLAGLGENVVNMLSFGCEQSDISRLRAAADVSRSLKSSDRVRQLVSQGKSYPSAVAAAADGCGVSDIFSSPNSLLAIEYIKAVEDIAPWIGFNAVKRFAAEHDGENFSGVYASAGYVRGLIERGEDYSQFVPREYQGEPRFLKNADKTILYSIMTADKRQLLKLPDMNENLANRFISVRKGCKSTQDFLAAFKNRSVTLARARRMVLNLTLGVTAEDCLGIPYGRILALNQRGREILAAAKNKTLDYDTSLKRLEQLSEKAGRISHLEQNAVKLWDLCVKGVPEFTDEYTKKITISKEDL